MHFYLFTLPVYDFLAGWLIGLTFVIFLVTLLYSLLTLSQQTKTLPMRQKQLSVCGDLAVVGALALVTLAINTYLSRFPYLWEDHQTFTGVTYTEANYLLPALLVVAIALVVAALLRVIQVADQKKSASADHLGRDTNRHLCRRSTLLVPTYINSFIVKPNELERETPYIQHNIAATRRAFGLEGIEQREFDAENSVAALDLDYQSADARQYQAVGLASSARHAAADSGDSAPITIFQRSMSIAT